MENIIEADYKVVEEELTLPQIVADIKAIESIVFKVTLDGAINVGRKLQIAKEKVGHGGWEEWCKSNLGYSQRQAQRYIEISTHYGDENSPYSKATLTSDLSITKALTILKVPEEQVENFVKDNEVDSATVKELEEKVKSLQEENVDKNMLLEEMSKELEEATENKDKHEEETEKLRAELEKLKNQEESPETKAKLQEMHDKLIKAEREAEEEVKKINEMKRKLESAEAEKNEAIKEALEKGKAQASAEAQKEAQTEITKAKQEAESAMERALAAEHKAELASNEDAILLKIKVNDLQNDFEDALNCISNVAIENKEQAQKMKNALGKVLDVLAERLVQ